jgi:hypothetical protein
MDKAGALLKELKEVAKDVGVLEKSTKLSSLIKQVRACKTAAEERALIAKESAAMRAEFREQARFAALRWRRRARAQCGGALGGNPDVCRHAERRLRASAPAHRTPRCARARWPS